MSATAELVVLAANVSDSEDNKVDDDASDDDNDEHIPTQENLPAATTSASTRGIRIID